MFVVRHQGAYTTFLGDMEISRRVQIHGSVRHRLPTARQSLVFLDLDLEVGKIYSVPRQYLHQQ